MPFAIEYEFDKEAPKYGLSQVVLMSYEGLARLNYLIRRLFLVLNQVKCLTYEIPLKWAKESQNVIK